MTLKIIPRSFGIAGMALWPFILLSTRFKSDEVPVSLLTHERIHLRQQIELLVIGFYLWYFIERVVKAIRIRSWARSYYHVSFEREAFLYDPSPGYLKSRKFWSFLEYM